MGKKKIDLAKMGKMLLGGKSPQDCMKEFGCSEVAFYKAKKKLSVEVAKDVTKVPGRRIRKKAEETQFNASQQLDKINRVTNQLLDQLTGEDHIIDSIVKAVRAVLDYENDPTNAKLKQLKALILRISQDNNTVIKACAELRAQVDLRFDISKQFYDITQIKKFQKIVVQTIGEAAPDVRNRIIQKLRENRSLRGLVDVT